MGDRWHLKLRCAWCRKENPKPTKDSENWMDDYVYFAPSSGFTTFKCDYCGKENKIVEDFKTIKKEN